MPQLVWFVTGCSSGLGLELSKAALVRGDKVIATARAPVSRLSALEAAGANILEVDVSAKQDVLFSVAAKAIKIHGRVDVLVCNAGYGEMGVLEDISTEGWSRQLSVNLFGAINIGNAFLPHFRGRKEGTIAFINSVYGHAVAAGAGAYCVSKFALNAYARTLAQEVAHLNIRSISFDTGYFKTPVLDNFSVTGPTSPDYTAIGEMLQSTLGSMNDNQPGDPIRFSNAVIDVVKGEGLAKDRPAPGSVPMGTDAFFTVRKNAEKTIQWCDQWEDLARSVDYPEPKKGFFAQVEHYA